MIVFSLRAILIHKLPNGWRYPLVGGTRQRHFAGTHSKPRELPENAQTPTSRVHAVLGTVFCGRTYATSFPRKMPGAESRITVAPTA